MIRNIATLSKSHFNGNSTVTLVFSDKGDKPEVPSHNSSQLILMFKKPLGT